MTLQDIFNEMDKIVADFQEQTDELNEQIYKLRKEAFKLQKHREEMERDLKADREYFDSVCPYTDRHCEDWNCKQCYIERAEREYLESEAENE
jgi:hypothetical protein